MVCLRWLPLGTLGRQCSGGPSERGVSFSVCALRDFETMVSGHLVLHLVMLMLSVSAFGWGCGADCVTLYSALFAATSACF